MINYYISTTIKYKGNPVDIRIAKYTAYQEYVYDQNIRQHSFSTQVPVIKMFVR